MSSESRNELLESLLGAKYDLECCDDGEKGDAARHFESCVAEVLKSHPKISRLELIEAIGFKYREYKIARLRAQRRRETL